MAVPLIDPAAQHAPLMSELEAAFRKVIASGSYILGSFVEQFEQDLAAYCGVRHCVGVSSGTDALLAAMMALGIGPGDEVITTPFTFFCTASCVSRLGATPVFVDVHPGTFNIEADDIEAAITPATRAIIPVHLFGLPANMSRILDIARRHNLHVIEDAAQALGARCDDKPVGSIGDIGCFSFYPTKTLPGFGDAGACVTNDDQLAEKLRILRVHGLEPGRNYEYHMIGGNFRLDALQAALLNVKLPHVQAWNDRRRTLANRYHQALEDRPVSTPFEPPTRHHVFGNYTIRVRGGSRDGLLNHLQALNIAARVYYPIPLHLQPAFQPLGYRRGRFPAAESAAAEVLSLPIYPEMTDAQQDEVIEAVRQYFRAE